MTDGSNHPGAEPADAVDSIVEETRRQLRAPGAAGIAGIAFAILFTVALWLLRSIPPLRTDAEVAAWFASGGDTAVIIGGLYLAPFAGVAFLWFVAVVRDQIGDREDRFFATVFFGSGVMFVTLLFVAAAIITSIVVGPRNLDQTAPSADTVRLLRTLGYTTVFAFATRASALFMISTATIGLRSGTFPRPFAVSGYVLGLVLLIAVSFADWIILILPAWVAVTSVFILLRERSRRAQPPSR